MKNNITLKDRDSLAINKFKNSILAKFPEAKFILYGSRARGEDTRFSDIDILVLLDRKITTRVEEDIFGIGFEVGLIYDVVFGIVVDENAFWNSPLSKAMPFHWMVSKDGIVV